MADGHEIFHSVIFKVYDTDGNGKVTFHEMLDILRDLTGQFISEQQREVAIHNGCYFVLITFLFQIFMISPLYMYEYVIVSITYCLMKMHQKAKV